MVPFSMEQRFISDFSLIPFRMKKKKYKRTQTHSEHGKRVLGYHTFVISHIFICIFISE